MNYAEIPADFGAILAKNEEATNAFSMMTRKEKQRIWAIARREGSQQAVQQIVANI